MLLADSQSLPSATVRPIHQELLPGLEPSILEHNLDSPEDHTGEPLEFSNFSLRGGGNYSLPHTNWGYSWRSPPGMLSLHFPLGCIRSYLAENTSQWACSTHPESGRRDPVGWGPKLSKNKESELNTSVHLCSLTAEAEWPAI